MRIPAVVVLAVVGCVAFSQLRASIGAADMPQAKSSFQRADDQYVASLSNPDEVRNLADTALRVLGIPEEINLTEIRERIFRAELKARQGSHPRITEGQVVSTINKLAKELDLPPYAYTSASQLRVLRQSLLPQMPNMLGESLAKKQPKTFSPLEVVFLSTILIRQKMVNPYYQVTPEEFRRQQRENDKKGFADKTPKVFKVDKDSKRRQLEDIIHGHAHSIGSVQDVIAAAHSALDDFGIEK